MAEHSFERHHARLAGFDAFFQGELAQRLEQQEAERRRHVRPVLLKGAAIVLLCVVVLFAPALMDDLDGDVIQIAMAAAFFGGFLGLRWVSKPLREAKQQATHTLLEGVCGFLKLSFSPSVGDFDYQRFREAGVVPSYDRKYLEDRLQGEHEGVAFDLIEARLQQRRTTTDSKGRTRTTYVTVFNGLLIDAASPRSFQGRTVVTSDGGWIGNFFGGMGRKGERVTLESPEFEKHYEVYASDQVEARVLLTTTMLERLVELRARLGDTPRLAFVNGRLLIAVPRKGDQFEAGGLFSSLTDRAHIDEALAELCAIFTILDTLALQESASA